MRFLCVAVMHLLFAVSLCCGSEFCENEYLKLYVSFDTDAQPEIAQDGAKLKKTKNIRLVEGRVGKAVYLSSIDNPLTDLDYDTGNALKGDEWTISFWFKADVGKKPLNYFLRTYSSGAWGEGDITACFTKWDKISFSRFDGNKNRRECNISANAIGLGYWKHITLVNNNGKVCIYIDGFQVNPSRNQDVDIPAPLQNGLRLGCSSLTQNNYFSGGAIDEMKVFNKALSEKEVKAILESKPTQAQEPTPSLFVPFEGRIDPITKTGVPIIGSDRIAFKKSVIGKGVEITRHGYDSRGYVTLGDLNGVLGQQMTAVLFFTPNWDSDDQEVHGLLHATDHDNGFSWMLLQHNGILEFIVSKDNNKTAISTAINGWEKSSPVHLSCGYSASINKIFLAINGKVVAEADFNLKPSEQQATLFVGDYANCDMYRKSQADGIIDELKIYEYFLDIKQIGNEINKSHNLQVKNKIDLIAPLISLPVMEKERALWAMDVANLQNGELRKKICLNALWRFQLTLAGQAPKSDDWKYLAVPGRYSGQENGLSDHEFFMRNKELMPVEKNQIWNGIPSFKYFDSWFERSIHINTSMKGKHLLLCFDEISPTSTAIVYFNGKEIGCIGKKEINYEIPIDDMLVNYNDDNFILIHVNDTGDRWSWRGIKGNVWLETRSVAEIINPYVVTSVKNKNIQFSAEIKNYSAMSKTYSLSVKILGKNAPHDFKSSMVNIDPNETSKVKTTFDWGSAELWDYENPYMYSCRVEVIDENNEVVDCYPEFKFGFREFSIEGPDYYLNGKKVHLRNHNLWMNSSANYDMCCNLIHNLKEMGYNSIRLPFKETDLNMGNILKSCDENGMMLFANVYGVDGEIYTAWSNPSTRKDLEKAMANRIQDLRNHPSVVMWYMSVNYLGYGLDFHPKKMMDGYLPEFKKDKYKICLEAVNILKTYDNSRPYFFQAGGAFGPVINNNAYFCWWPQAEKNSWIYEWGANPQKPFYVIETSFPYYRSFFGMDLHHSTAKPLFVAENAARYFGQSAYTNIETELAGLITKARGTSGRDKRSPSQYIPWQFMDKSREFMTVERLKTYMLVQTIWNWRALGISGICPFNEMQYAFAIKKGNCITAGYEKQDFNQPGWHPDICKYPYLANVDLERPLGYYNAIKKAFYPKLIFIGSEKINPTSQAANYYSGENIDKDIVIINDALNEDAFEISWDMSNHSGKIVARGNFTKNMIPGQIARIPLSITAPQVDDVEEYAINIMVKNHDEIIVDPLTLRIFKKRKYADENVRIVLYDEEGVTANSLKDLDVTVSEAKLVNNLNECNLVIIGRKSFGRQFVQWANKVKLVEWLNSGMGNVLMLEQTPDSLRMLGLDSNAIYAREAFSAQDDSLGFARLTNMDLRNWHGNATLSDEKIEPDPETGEKVVSPLWHWRNLDMVCSFPIRRPETGAFTDLIVCGKDLIYTPLVEFNSGKGIFVCCQMEVSGRTQTEPAAAALLSSLISKYSQSSQKRDVIKFPTVLLGKGELFGRLGFIVKPFETIKDNSKSIIIVNQMIEKDRLAELTKFAENGSTVIFAFNDIKTFSALGLRSKSQKVQKFTVKEQGRGIFGDISSRNRYFRYPITVNTLLGEGFVPLTEPAFAVEKRIASGRFIFLQVNTDLIFENVLRAKEESCDSSSCWAELILFDRCSNLWTELLKNLGAPYERISDRLVNPALPPIKLDLNGMWDFLIDPAEKGLKNGWHLSEDFINIQGWHKLNVPGFWENQGILEQNPNIPLTKYTKGYDGYAWYRRTFEIPENLRNKQLIFHADAIDDFDHVYVNGKLIGSTDKETDGYWHVSRNYVIPKELSENGKLSIAIRVFDERGEGGVCGNVYVYEKQKDKLSPLPYLWRPMPGYNTECSVRW